MFPTTRVISGTGQLSPSGQVEGLEHKTSFLYRPLGKMKHHGHPFWVFGKGTDSALFFGQIVPVPRIQFRRAFAMLQLCAGSWPSYVTSAKHETENVSLSPGALLD